MIGLIGIAGGRIVNDRDWSRAYHEGLETIGEDLGGIRFTANPQVNRQGNAAWKAYIKRPSLLRGSLRASRYPSVFINGGSDIRPKLADAASSWHCSPTESSSRSRVPPITSG